MLDAQNMVTLQRARGQASVAFAGDDSRLLRLRQAGCLKAMLPRNHAPVPDVVLINTSGGLTGGDHLSVEASLDAGARAAIATQTAERVYRSRSGAARVDVSLTLGDGCALDWLPQETILFDHSALDRRIDVNMGQGAQLLMVEPIIFGRAAMGESLNRTALRDNWRIRRGGDLIHAESLRIDGPFDAYRGIGCLGAAQAVATILYVADDAEARLGPVRDMGLSVSAWDGRLVVRLVADSPRKMRGQLIDFLTKFRNAPVPRVWTM